MFTIPHLQLSSVCVTGPPPFTSFLSPSAMRGTRAQINNVMQDENGRQLFEDFLSREYPNSFPEVEVTKIRKTVYDTLPYELDRIYALNVLISNMMLLFFSSAYVFHCFFLCFYLIRLLTVYFLCLFISLGC